MGRSGEWEDDDDDDVLVLGMIVEEGDCGERDGEA